MIVGDASVILQFIFKGGRCPYSDAFEQALGHTPVWVPPLFRIEMAHVLRKKELYHNWPMQTSEDMVALLESLLIYQEIASSASFLLKLQRRYGLSAYDAVYLSLAFHLDAPLATTDKKLSKAAKAEGLYWQP
jgi:predicted nucleic acid-binding protein